jgi:copper chaperone CopZ
MEKQMFALNSVFEVQNPQQRALVAVRGMSSARCASSVASALKYIPGVEEVAVSLETGEASICFDPRKVESEQFRTAVRAVGFDAQLVEEEALLA